MASSKTFDQVVAEAQESKAVKTLGIVAAICGVAVLMAYVFRKKT